MPHRHAPSLETARTSPLRSSSSRPYVSPCLSLTSYRRGAKHSVTISDSDDASRSGLSGARGAGVLARGEDSHMAGYEIVAILLGRHDDVKPT